ncbi:hypothetical protein BAE44_0021860 [Dichanthelium oligosanthes]|uniref:Uncharacterized protein n=1 Tax=Dichanthelium oligosanthes TaxID=888268 RepID=A0A1E5UW88_9POAL|nr:hypothetical protein BAE44_0021860 [Dichanthelium oligosanthes]
MKFSSNTNMASHSCISGNY